MPLPQDPSANSDATLAEGQLPDGSIPHFIISWDQLEDGSYFAQIRMVGLKTERMAQCAAKLFEEKFCAGEIDAH